MSFRLKDLKEDLRKSRVATEGSAHQAAEAVAPHLKNVTRFIKKRSVPVTNNALRVLFRERARQQLIAKTLLKQRIRAQPQGDLMMQWAMAPEHTAFNLERSNVPGQVNADAYNVAKFAPENTRRKITGEVNFHATAPVSKATNDVNLETFYHSNGTSKKRKRVDAEVNYYSNLVP